MVPEEPALQTPRNAHLCVHIPGGRGREGGETQEATREPEKLLRWTAPG